LRFYVKDAYFGIDIHFEQAKIYSHEKACKQFNIHNIITYYVRFHSYTLILFFNTYYRLRKFLNRFFLTLWSALLV